MSDLLKQLGKPLSIEDVDFRIQSINNGGYATILAYKDARVDMNRLDEVCGMNWQKDFKLIDGNLFCGVGIFTDNQWIWRWDVGTESNTEKEKGQASDAFKRACFCWGIGRELYNYPVIQVKLNSDEFTTENNKSKPTWNLQIKLWVWESKFDDKGHIVYLKCIDNKGNIRFNWSKGNVQAQPMQETSEEKLNKATTLDELQKAYLSLPKQEQERTAPLKDKLKIKLTPIIKDSIDMAKEDLNAFGLNKK